MDELIKNYMPEMLTGKELDNALRAAPGYDSSIMRVTEGATDRATGPLWSIYSHGDGSGDLCKALSGASPVNEQKEVAYSGQTVQREPEPSQRKRIFFHYRRK